jgi:uncharacterized membrane protein
MGATGSDWPGSAEADPGLRLALPARRVPVGHGWDWIARGWKLFTRAPLMWIVSLLILVVAAVVMNFIPLIGGLAFHVLNAAIAAGFIVACRSLELGNEFELEHLFAGFRTHFGSLLVVGLLFLAGEAAIFLVFVAFAGFPLIGVAMSGDAQEIATRVMASLMTIALGGLVALALLVPLMAAIWFAPALVVLHGVGPVEAMKQSFIGCFRNFWSLFVYGLVMTLFALLIPLTLGLGAFVWVPLAIASTYAAYREIYTAEPMAPAPVAAAA